MKNRLLYNIMGMVVLALMAQNISGAELAKQVYPELTRETAAKAAPAGAGWFGGLSGWRPSTPSWISEPASRAWQGVKSFGQQYTPSMETVKAVPSNVWSGIASRAGSLYEMRPRTMEEAGQMASALPGQTYGLAKTGLATYAGRPVMSAGSWLGSKIGSGWDSYAPQTAQEYAGQAAQYIPSAPAWLPNMSEESKQAAVGLAALLAAGYLAKQGYNRLTGPSVAFNEFKESMNAAIAPMLKEYAYVSTEKLALNILKQINGYKDLINGEVTAGTLSQPEADSLIANLMRMKVQLEIIKKISDQITQLSKEYEGENSEEILNFYNAIGSDPILTSEQKGALQQKVNTIFIANKAEYKHYTIANAPQAENQ